VTHKKQGFEGQPQGLIGWILRITGARAGRDGTGMIRPTRQDASLQDRDTMPGLPWGLSGTFRLASGPETPW
jgi:hypothetical protein